MGSTRLPGKVLADIQGQPMLWHVVKRVRRASGIHRAMVATSASAGDDPIARFCAAREILCFRGNEDDVLDRYYRAAKCSQADVVVRITADCPLIDAAVIDRVIAAFFQAECDYATNTLRYTYPDGLDTEVFSFRALERAWLEAKLPAEREHVTPYFKNSGRFRVLNVENNAVLDPNRYRWTVDDARDLEFARAICARFNGRSYFGLQEILQVIDEDPAMGKLISAAVRNEGYYKSLLKEAAAPPRPRPLERSYSLKAKAEKLIPSCTQTWKGAFSSESREGLVNEPNQGTGRRAGRCMGAFCLYDVLQPMRYQGTPDKRCGGEN